MKKREKLINIAFHSLLGTFYIKVPKDNQGANPLEADLLSLNGYIMLIADDTHQLTASATLPATRCLLHGC